MLKHHIAKHSGISIRPEMLSSPDKRHIFNIPLPLEIIPISIHKQPVKFIPPEPSDIGYIIYIARIEDLP